MIPSSLVLFALATFSLPRTGAIGSEEGKPGGCISKDGAPCVEDKLADLLASHTNLVLGGYWDKESMWSAPIRLGSHMEAGSIFCYDCEAASVEGPSSEDLSAKMYRVPGEYEPHQKTYMVWPGGEASRWSGSHEALTNLQYELFRIASTISMFEPVTIIVDQPQLKEAAGLSWPPGTAILLLPSDDIWARDSLPIFAMDMVTPGIVLGLDLNYHVAWNGQDHRKDTRLSRNILNYFSIPRLVAQFQAEGGAFEFDGEGTLLVTESSTYNKNRNPHFATRLDIEDEMKRFFKVDKIIWLRGDYGSADSTDVHVDALVRFVRPGEVVLDWPHPKGYSCNCSEQALEVLKEATDAKGRRFKVTVIQQANPEYMFETVKNSYDNAGIFSYVNFLIVNGGVLLPQFGDWVADTKALIKFEELFPERKIVPVPAVYVGSAGGGIHCVTKHMPKVLWP